MKLKFSDVPFSIIVDTRANILALTPLKSRVAFATDTDRFYIADGTNWKVTPLRLSSQTSADVTPDIGAIEQDYDLGYDKLRIVDKDLHNVSIRDFSRTPKEGSLRTQFVGVTSNKILQVYVSGEWKIVRALSTAETDDIVLYSDIEELVFDETLTKVEKGGIIPRVDIGAIAAPVFIDGGTV